MNTPPDREQLRRDCSDALEVLRKYRNTDRIAELSDAIRELGPTYRSHGELMKAALYQDKNTTIIWHLLNVLEKLERKL
jgi:hypothetical protein